MAQFFFAYPMVSQLLGKRKLASFHFQAIINGNLHAVSWYKSLAKIVITKSRII